MEKFIIEGGSPLIGEVKLSGSKNACLPIMAATLLAPGKHIIHNIPSLGDVKTMMRILEVIGVDVRREDHTLIIDTSKASNPYVPYELVSTMRASFLITGALISRFGEAKVARPGGCAIGYRPIDEHLHGFKAIGIKIKEDHGYIHAKKTQNAKRKTQNTTEVYLNEKSVTATENILLASVCEEGETQIINGAREPHVMELINFLVSIGAKINITDDIIIVKGEKELSPKEWTISPDYIEAGTFMIGAAITGGEVTMIGAKWDDSVAEITKLQEIGVTIDKMHTGIRVKMTSPIKPTNIKTAPYPGFPTDLQPQITSLLTLAQGTAVITETMYEHRFNHIPELCRMGAEIEIEDRNAIIKGVKELSGAKVMCSDIRCGASLVIAGLAAKGKTEIARIYHIDRGYEKLEVKLSQLGAKIKRV